MLAQSSRVSAASQSVTRGAEKAQNTHFPDQFARTHGVFEYDNEGNEESSKKDHNEYIYEGYGDYGDYGDFVGCQHHEDDQIYGLHDDNNNITSRENREANDLRSPPAPLKGSARSTALPSNLAPYQHIVPIHRSVSTPSTTAVHTLNLVPPADLSSGKDRERLSEPSSVVAGRPRNLHIPITISDDRSEDSDINSRVLLALRSRNQGPGGVLRPATPQKPPSPSPFEGIASKSGNPGGVTGVANQALVDYQTKLLLLEQQNKMRRMMQYQKQDSTIPRPDLPSNIYLQTGQPGGSGSEQSPNLPGGVNTTVQSTWPRYARDLAPQPTSQAPDQQNFNRPSEERQEVNMWTSVLPPPMPINKSPFSAHVPERAALAGQGARTPEIGVDGMHPANNMPSSGYLMSHYNGDVGTSNFFDSSMASANPTNIQSKPLDVSDESNSDLNKLLAHIEALQRRADALKLAKREQDPPQYMILHRLSQGNSSTVYLDAPQWALGQDSSRVLKSSLPLSNVSAYLGKHPTVAFVVYRKYDVTGLISTPPEDEREDCGENTGVFPSVKHTEESISIISDDLVLTLTEFLKTVPEFTEVADSISRYAEVPAPYLFIYHSRSVIQQYLEVLPEQRRKRLSCLLFYIYSMYREEYNEVDSLLQRKKIRLQYIKYLFKPGDVVVERKDQDIRGFCTRSELSESTVQRTSTKKNAHLANYVETLRCLLRDDEQPSAKVDSNVYNWKISGWSWKFDGTFSRISSSLELSLEVNDKQEQSEVDINELNIYPLAFANECLKQRLKKRGEMFWKCRFQHLVSYHDDDRHDLDGSADERYMIDLMTYRELHKQQSEGQKGYVPEDFKDDLGPEMMKRKDPPNEKFIYLLPLSIKGFNLQRKRWVDLRVDRMDEVVWNKKAFKSLVLAHKTKDLIQALVSKQLDSEKSTDLIQGKGNGLILLLHGGPGTGKTLTAESVAEIAEKPLYRVTCGDIGTEPEEVEAYLESVLHLGKIWKGVVLLDEADVFLEQRSLDDLRRNALVSIFLRVLEYYDGILVLTSNRVGTFDEAFKSRIQLALHYPKLDHAKRAKVWENFIERLEDLKENNIDFIDLRYNIRELAKNRMNGREIRNAITLARQYTQWKATNLNFTELQDIIKISGQFDVYLSELNHNITQDQLAQDDGLRLAEADK